MPLSDCMNNPENAPNRTSPPTAAMVRVELPISNRIHSRSKPPFNRGASSATKTPEFVPTKKFPS
ncbi:MAG: hypothetical protein BWY82_02109 [Verrucomicrobia bacterium ADurb.Bin474]|nr:MAG: hypothetical protein BWY82_02109 [Verrucomicrobia bacterium ADurb.Bin474]